MPERLNREADTITDAVDLETFEFFSRFHGAKRQRPSSMRSRERRKKGASPGSIRQRRNKRYF